MADVKDLEPYSGNAEGLTAVLQDLKSTMPSAIVFKVTGYLATPFENVTQGDALYSRVSDGQVGKAIASSSLDQATVAGFAETTKTAGQTVKVIVAGQIATAQTLEPGELYFLSNTTLGRVIKIPPTTTGQYVTPVGEALAANELIIRIKRPILLR